MPKVLLRSVVYFFFLVGFFFSSHAQNRDIFWHFGGNTNSVEFTKPAMNPQLITLPNTLGTGGGAVASDYINGELLFYTDGINVYADDDSQIATLTGSTTRNQAAAVCLNPADADTSEYYLFTIDNAGQIRSSVYDKDIFRNSVFPFPPDGDMDPARTNIVDPDLPATVLSEGMIIIANEQRDGFWLITHELGTTNYNVTQIDNSGISTVTTALAGAPTDVANFSYSDTRNQIGVSPTNGADNITILDIDLATGALSLSGIDLSAITNTSVYDTEWSSSGDYLYLSGNFGNAIDELYRFDLNTSAVDTVLTSGIQNSFGLQYGADTAIYHLYENAGGEFRLGRIEDPNNVDIAQTLYNPAAIGNDDFQGQQFPSFLPPYNLVTIDFTFSGTCANVPTYFFPEVSPDFESIAWDFEGTGTFTPLTGGSYTYTAAGDYDVTMVVNLGGAIDSVSKTVTIQDFDLSIQIDPQRQYWCTDDFGDREDPATSIVTYTATASGANSAGATIRWSNQTAAEANATTTFVEPGTYYVVATDPTTGCEAYMEQQVFEYGVQNTFAHVWYFGDHGGLDFNPLFDNLNPGPITPIDFNDPDIFNGGNKMESPQGCAVYCDGNGDPILYSDGQEVYNKAGTQLTDDLGGNEVASQSIFFVENPADATQYFLFFTQEVPNADNRYDFSYAVYDLKMLDGEGDLVRSGGEPIVTTLYSNSTERITGNANWVITHEFGNNIFRAYPMNGQGIGAPVFSNVGEVHEYSNTSGKGYMKLSADKLAVALSISDTENYIDLFDFDVTTGAITPVVTLDFPETGQAYGVEFSPDNGKIYTSLRNSGGGTRIVAWEIDTTTIAGQITDPQYIMDSDTIIHFESGVDMGALQQGPQGTIYIAKDGATTLASINNPNDINDPQFNLTTADFANVGNEVGGGSNNSRLGLPNFVDFNGSSTPSASLSVTNGCQNQTLTFTVLNPLSDPQIESYVVQVYDDTNIVVGTSPTLDANTPSWDFTNTGTPGNYEAQLFILNTCGLATASAPRQAFVINPLPTVGTITTTPSSCQGNDGTATIPFTSTGTITYEISGPVAVPVTTVTSPTSEIVNNLSAGFYTLTVTQAFAAGSCSDTFNFSVQDDSGYTVTAAEDTQANCNDEDGAASFSFTAGSGSIPTTFTWELRNQSNNAVVVSGNETDVTASPLASGDYYFQVEDGSGCITTATVTITQPAELNLVIGTIEPSCDDDPVVIDITTDAAQLVTVHEFVNGGIGDEIPNYDIIDSNDSISISRPGDVDGTFEYVVVAPGELNGPCSNAELISVSFGSSDPSPFDRAYAICTFEQDEDLNSVKFSNSPDGFTSVQWFDEDGNEITSGSNPDYVFRNDSLVVMTFGRITAELTNVFGCVTSEEINIIQDCKARINAPNAFTPDGNGTNDTWTVFPFLVASDEFEIFIHNRWGELVFQSDDLSFMVNDGWNGGYDNDPSRPLPGGTYAYKVQFKNTFDDDAELQESRGGITVVR